MLYRLRGGACTGMRTCRQVVHRVSRLPGISVGGAALGVRHGGLPGLGDRFAQ